MKNSIDNDKMCTSHPDKPIVFVCFHSGCYQPFLCRLCYQDHHNREHEGDIKEIFAVQKDDLIKRFEEEKAHILNQQQDVDAQLNKVISYSKDLINVMMDKVAKNLEEKRDKLINEFDEFGHTEKSTELKELISRLERNFKTIRESNFDGCDLVEDLLKIRNFSDKIFPSTQSLIADVERILETLKLDKSKLDLYEKELCCFVDNLSLKNFFLLSPFRSLKDVKISDVMKKEYDQSKANVKNRAVGMDEDLLKLKHDCEMLAQELKASGIEDEEEIVPPQFEGNLADNVEILNKENQVLRMKVIALTNQLHTLISYNDKLFQYDTLLNNKIKMDALAHENQDSIAVNGWIHNQKDNAVIPGQKFSSRVFIKIGQLFCLFCSLCLIAFLLKFSPSKPFSVLYSNDTL